MRGALRRFLSSRRGAAALTVALAALPLTIGAGVAVDLSRLYLLRSRLLTATDAAALAGARALTDADRDAQVRRMFWANFTRHPTVPERGYMGATVRAADLTVQALPDGRTLQVSATARMPTTLMAVAGVREMRVSAENLARRQDLGLELSLVLDVTGSMQGTAMTSLRAAAADLVNILYGGRETVEGLSVAVAPYTSTVNVGRQRAGWLAAGSLDPNAYLPTVWRGCVDARWDAGGDETDATPAEIPFRPFHWRSTLGRHGANKGDNDWSSSSVTEPDPENPPTDAAQNAVGNTAVGPNLGCPRAVTGLTRERARVLGEIAALRATHRGGTMANVGLQMGWATLSPRWRGLWGDPAGPLDYDARYNRKALVMMTDGANEWYDWPEAAPGACTTRATGPCFPGYVSDGDADRTAYGRLLENRLGVVPPLTIPRARTEINARMSRLCSRIKGAGITVYTIVFAVNDASTQALYRACASAPEMYFNSPNGAALRAAFQEIGQQLAGLRLVR